MRNRLTRQGRWLTALGLLSALLPAAATAQPVDFSQQNFSSTLAQVEKSYGWYDGVNYGAAEVGYHSQRLFVPNGVEMGNYILYMTLGAGTTYDDNIYALAGQRVGDFQHEARASVALRSRFQRHLLDFYLDGRYVAYAENDDQNHLDGRALAEWRLDIDHGHALGGRLQSRYDHEDRLAPEAPLGAKEPVPVFRNEAEIALTRDQGRLGASFGLDFADHDYADVKAFDGSIIDQDFRDMTSYGAYLRLNHRFSPGYKLLATARVGREEYHSSDSALRDATLYEGQAGLAFELSPLWRAYVTAGYGFADYDFDGRRSFGAFVYDGRLQWLVSPVLTMTLSAGQSIDEASFGSSGALLETRAELKAQYEAMRNLMLTASLGYEQAEIDGHDRTDDIYTGKIGAEYTINKNILFTLGFEHQQRFSTDPDHEAQVNRYMAGIKIRF